MENILAENMYSQCDKHGKKFRLLDKVTEQYHDASSDPFSNGNTTILPGTKSPKKNTGVEITLSMERLKVHMDPT
jgi:hypothetical protein